MNHSLLKDKIDYSRVLEWISELKKLMVVPCSITSPSFRHNNLDAWVVLRRLVITRKPSPTISHDGFHSLLNLAFCHRIDTLGVKLHPRSRLAGQSSKVLAIEINCLCPVEKIFNGHHPRWYRICHMFLYIADMSRTRSRFDHLWLASGTKRILSRIVPLKSTESCKTIPMAP